MADTIAGLFGLDSIQVRQQQELEAQKFGTDLANTFVDPYEKANAQRGAMLGNTIANFGSRLFGLQTPELKRATTLESILQQTTEEVGSQDPAVLYPELARRLNAAGFTREALQVGSVGEQAKRSVIKEQADMNYKQSMSNYTDMLRQNQEAALESKRIEQQGQVAYGALQAYKTITDPKGKERVWDSALNSLAKKGLDIEALKDIPYEQRESTLNSIVEGSDSSATRTKAEIATMQNQFRVEKQQQDLAMKQQTNDLKAAIANLQAEVNRERIGSAKEVAMTRQIDNFGNQLKLLQIKQADDVNAQAASAVGTKEFNKEISAYLKNDVGITDANEVKAAITEFNTLYKNYLGKRNESGFPMYDNVTALNQAKKDLEGKVTVEEGFFKDATRFSGKASKPKVIKLD